MDFRQVNETLELITHLNGKVRDATTGVTSLPILETQLTDAIDTFYHDLITHRLDATLNQTKTDFTLLKQMMI
jgi:hypothetical protein